MKKFNLSEWALEHRSLVWYFMIIFTIAGIFSYINLGREEDPNFTIKTMVISAQWPGASIEDTTTQITERIEKKLEELDTLDYTRSVSSPGTTTIFVNLKDTVRGEAVTQTWVRVRNMIRDISSDLPQGVVGPFFNDQFGDVFGNVYGFTADGLSRRQLRDYVEDVRRKILTVPDVGKVELVGAQDEVIYLEFSTKQIAALGLDQQVHHQHVAGTKCNHPVRRRGDRSRAGNDTCQWPVYLGKEPGGDQSAGQRSFLSAE